MQAYKSGHVDNSEHDVSLSNEGLFVQTELELSRKPFELPSAAFCYGHVHLDMGATCCASFGADGQGMNIAQISLADGKRKYLFRQNNKISDALPNDDMNDPIIALRAGDGTAQVAVQVFRLKDGGSEKLGDYRFEEDILYWTWLGPEFLALVTPTAVWHWDLKEAQSVPRTALKRDGPLAQPDIQIIGYKCDTNDPKTVTWGLLEAICEGKVAGTIDGHMQLYNFERIQQQWLEGYCGTFGIMKDTLAGEGTLMIAFVQKEAGKTNTRLHVMDLAVGQNVTRRETPRKNVEDFLVPPSPNGGIDFLVALEFSSRDGIIFGISKHGQILVFDGITAKLLTTHKISNDVVFVAGYNEELSRLFTCNRAGVISSIAIDGATFVDCLSSTLGDTEALKNLALRGGYVQADRENSLLFEAFMTEHDYTSAGRIVARMRSGVLRSDDTLDTFLKSAPSSVAPLISSLMSVGRLNSNETKIYVKMLAQGNKLDQVIELFRHGKKFTMSKSLAEMMIDNGYQSFAEEAFVTQTDAFQHYDPVDIREFLMTLNLQIPRPLVEHCHNYGFIEELIIYLFEHGQIKYLIAYATKVAPDSLGLVVNTLIFEGADDAVLKQLIEQVDVSESPPEPLIAILDERDKLMLMHNLLENCVQSNMPSPIIHTAYIKTLILQGLIDDARFQLKSNHQYEPEEIGLYCTEKGQPELAFLAFTRSKDASFDRHILQVTVEANLHMRLAQYALDRQDKALWKAILQGGTSELYGVTIGEGLQAEVIGAVIEEVSDCTRIEPVIVAVKCFMEAGIEESLIELIERILFHKCHLQDAALQSSMLQNILIKSAIHSSKSKVDEYITRLDRYDASDVAARCIKAGLFEEAIAIYRKAAMPIFALQVQVQHLNDTSRAEEMAAELSDPLAWQSLGVTFLDMVDELKMENGDETAIQDYSVRGIRAIGQSGEHVMSNVPRVMKIAKEQELYAELVVFLETVRQSRAAREKTASIEGELIIAHTKLGNLDAVSTILSKSTHLQLLMKVGESLLHASQGIEGAKALTVEESTNARKSALMIFEKNGSHAKMTDAFLESGDFDEALVSAQRANVPKTWTELCIKAIAQNKMTIADQAVEHIMSIPDLLENCVKSYEETGHGARLINVMENYYDCAPGGKPKFPAGICPPHVGTHLGLMYIQYNPQKLLSFLSIEGVKNSRVNKPRLVSACEKRGEMKVAMNLLLHHLEDHDAAVTFIMRYPAECYEHELFCDALKRVKTVNLIYSAVLFYCQYLPNKLNGLLIRIAPRLDMAKLIQTLSKFIAENEKCDVSPESPSLSSLPVLKPTDKIPIGLKLIFPFLIAVQSVRVPPNRKELLSKLCAEFPLIYDTSKLESVATGDHTALNTAANQCYLSLGDVSGLEFSLASTTNYEKNSLAQAVRASNCLSFRRISALLFVKGGSMSDAVTTLLPRTEKDFTFISDLIAVAKQAKNAKLAQDLLKSLVDKKVMNTVVLCCMSAALVEYIPLSLIEQVAWCNLPTLDQVAASGQFLGPVRAEHGYLNEQKMELLSRQQYANASTPKIIPPSSASLPSHRNKHFALTGSNESRPQWDALNMVDNR